MLLTAKLARKIRHGRKARRRVELRFLLEARSRQPLAKSQRFNELEAAKTNKGFKLKADG
jgi:hypothetical protein